MESKSCVKFKTIFLSTKIVQDERLPELKKWCRIFAEQDLVPMSEGASTGNLSFRLKSGENKFVITASGLILKNDLSDDCFVLVSDCDFVNGIIKAQGTRDPSSESMLHHTIYLERPEIMAIFHGHSADILAKADSLQLPTTKIEQPYGSRELVDSVKEILNKNNFIIMKNHGFIALGKNLHEAGDLTLKINKSSIHTRLS